MNMSNIKIALLGLPLVVGACDQPKILCNTQHGGYAVRYTLLEGSGACAMLKTGVIGVQAYGSVGENMSPDWKRPPVALKTEETGTLIDEYGVERAATEIAAVGRFVGKNPDGSGFCAVEGLTPVKLSLAAVPAMSDGTGGMTEPLPATTLELAWSDVKFFVSAEIIGGEFTGELKYTKDGCTARYRVSGLYPATSCEDEAALGGVNPGLCLPCKGGAGISPAIETVCDPDAKVCLPKNEVPSYRSTPLVCPAPAPEPAPPKPDAAADAGADAKADAGGDGAGAG
jgi:hypothetical protein